jgi:hypothetical protein
MRAVLNIIALVAAFNLKLTRACIIFGEEAR